MTVVRRCTRRSRHLIALSAIALLALGCAGTGGAGPTGKSSIPTRRPSPSAPPPTSPAPAPRAAASPFASRRLRSYIASRSGHVTAALYDAHARRTWLLHPRSAQDTASIVKVEIMGTALQEAAAAGRDLPASEAALMPSMIENSDNDSATALLSDVGGPSAIARFDRSAGLTDTTPSTLALIPGTSLPGWGLTTTTALDEVTLVARFAYRNAVLSDASRKYGLSLMEHIEADQDWGVSGGVPAGTTVALKNGWLPLGPADWQVNSIGWISGHGRNYVLAVLTRGSPTEAYGIETVETIARDVYRSRAGDPRR
jgi:Beta-lactamase enzyme family